MKVSEFELSRDRFLIKGEKYCLEKNNGIPLIISHGFLSSYKSLIDYSLYFAEKGFIVYAFNFVGGTLFPSSSLGKHKDMTLESEYEDLSYVVSYVKERNSFGKVILLGESQGGFVSLMYASRKKEDVYALGAIYPALCIPSDARKGKMLWMKFNPEKIDETFKPKIIRLSSSYPKSAMNITLEEVMKETECPVFIVHGNKDNIVDIRYTKRAINLSKNNLSRYVEVEGGHGFKKKSVTRACEELFAFFNKLIAFKICVDKHDDDFTLLFSERKSFSASLDKFTDEQLKEKYDHNYFVAKRIPATQEIEKAIAYQKYNNDDYIKILSKTPLPAYLKDKFSFQESKILSMGFIKYTDSSSFRENGHLIIKEHSASSDLSKDILELEEEYYAETYGTDYIRKNMKRMLQKAEGQTGLHLIACYLDEKCVGWMYYFQNEEATVMDSLIVRKEERNKYIATSMIKYVVDHSTHNTYLHADDADTPKEIYKKLGFSQISVTYEYFRKL